MADIQPFKDILDNANRVREIEASLAAEMAKAVLAFTKEVGTVEVMEASHYPISAVTIVVSSEVFEHIKKNAKELPRG